MAKEFINPNLHVILIHYPLGLLTIGTLIELFAFLWRRSTFRAAGRWMILIGALSLVPTATIGLYAMADVNRTSETPDDATWEEVLNQSPVQGEAWEMLTRHGWYNAAGSAVILLLVVSYLAASDVFRRRMHFVYLILLVGGLVAIVLGAWEGGEMIYRHGVAVEVVRETADKPTTDEAGSGEESAAAEEQTEVKRGLEYYAPPLQVHVILAGLSVSLGLAAIGLSFRAGAQRDVAERVAADLNDINYALNPATRPPPIPQPAGAAAQMNVMDDPRMRQWDVRPRMPVARFWVLAALLGIAAAASGWWVLAYSIDSWVPAELWDIVKRDANDQQWRRMAHVVTGVGIVVLMLLLAVISRVAAGRRIVVGLFVLVLLAAIAAQVWFGSLLMFDTPMGDPWKFNSGAVETETSDEPPSTAPATTTTAPATTTTANTDG